MKRGFTLVELLMTLSVLAILFLIIVPEVSDINRKTKENEYERFLSDVFLSTEAYVQKNIDNYPNLNQKNKNVYIYFNELLESGYLKSTIVDPKNKKKVKDEDFTVQLFVNDDNEYKYKLLEERYVPDIIEGIELLEVIQNLLNNNTTYGNYTYMGGSYLKGEQDRNYVWYNGFLWRIMGINENGTIRLITEGNVTNIPYGGSGQGLTYTTNKGYINDWLNDYFLSNLDNGKNSIIKENEWCINPSTDSTSVRQNCDGGSIFNAKVGLITLDEYNLSGTSRINGTYYLNNKIIYRVLTPHSAYGIWFSTPDEGIVCGDADPKSSYGIRPVINVSGDAIITSGNGTLGNAYILNQTLTDKNGKLYELVSSGEYVSLSDKTYRVVSKEEDGIKLIYDGYYEEISGTPYTMSYGSSNTFEITSGIGRKLNETVLTWLGNSNKIIETNWYQTENGFGIGTPYTTILEDKTNPIRAKVGLIRVSEMLSGESASVLTNKYTIRSNNTKLSSYWMISKADTYSFPQNNPQAWYANYLGFSNYDQIISEFAVRPVIVVSTDTIITSGNGTLQKPYIIK